MEKVEAGTFVMVRFAKKNRHLFYVAHVENVGDDIIDVSFYKRSGDGFILPDNVDSDSVDRFNIDRVLPQPRSKRETARVALKLRVCKVCIDMKFGSRDVIPCPMPHEDELPDEPCQETGLRRDQVIPDTGVQRDLLRERCYCPHQKHTTACRSSLDSLPTTSSSANRSFGPQIDTVSTTMDDVTMCAPVPCVNAGCPEKFDKEALNRHLEQCQFQVVACRFCGERYKRNQLESTNNIKRTINAKVKPLEKVVAEVAMTVKKLSNGQEASETNGDRLVNAMRTVAHSSQQIEQVSGKVGVIERQIRDSGLDQVKVIESHSQNIQHHNELLNDFEKRMKSSESVSYEGLLIWRIRDYKRKKSDAIRGRQMSIYSDPFYSSRYGYKMCARAYLNGDGLGRGKCLSLFFVLMRGEYDELLAFPFKQRVTFTLLCPSNRQLHKHETLLPDPDSLSFRKPQNEMSIPSGWLQFALHSEVESSNFLVSDSIYIRVKVEPSGDLIA
ncbi:TNF receptor-associated factor 3-like [Watersipora subatra]|uniref:TNF receptor-associated factor 3-like n=1 Tax=Watersipora subatra TaxID=2589382 RepID=UPI00355C03A7